MCILVYYSSPSLLCPSIVLALFLFLSLTYTYTHTHSISLSRCLAYIPIFHVLSRMYAFIPIYPFQTPVILSLSVLQRRFPMCVSSLFPSLFWIHTLSTYLSLSHSLVSSTYSLGYLSTSAFSVSLPRKFIVSFRALTPSLSLRLVGIYSVSLALVYSSYLFVLRTPVCLRTHTRIPSE